MFLLVIQGRLLFLLVIRGRTVNNDVCVCMISSHDEIHN